MPENQRLVVFTGDLSFSVRTGIQEVDRLNPGLVWLIVLYKPSKSLSTVLHNQWFNLKRNGWRWICYTGTELFKKVISIITARFCPDNHKKSAPPTSLSGMLNLDILVVEDLYAAKTIEKITAYQPALGLSLAAPILKPLLFSIPKLGTINLHKGHLPYYRGMPPAFWELWNSEKQVGCSVHWMEEKLDTGDILQEERLDIHKYSTVRGLQVGLDKLGVKLMAIAVKNILAGDVEGVPQAVGGKTYRKPTLKQQAILKRRLSLRDKSIMNLIKNIVKNTAAYSLFLVSRILTGKLAPRITVILYHRVTDEVRDNLTVGVEQFDRQMALLKKHFKVLSIEEVINCSSIPVSAKPMVCVTFDDGYLDNYSNAAPILMKHGLPAAFFVSTGIVNSDNSFPHDERRGNKEIPKMTWDNLREMKTAGFTIGSHTVNHIDCASENEQTVLQELCESRDTLAQQLGITNPLFAYPYGGREHMTPGRLRLVKQAGYVGCLSAYGDVNINSVDRYNVLRRGIHWEFSDQAFLLECMGVR